MPGWHHVTTKSAIICRSLLKVPLPPLTHPVPAAVTRMSASKLAQGPNPSNSCIDSPVSGPPRGPTMGASAVSFHFPQTQKEETAVGSSLFTRSDRQGRQTAPVDILGFNLAPSQRPLNPTATAVPQLGGGGGETSTIPCRVTAGGRQRREGI